MAKRRIGTARRNGRRSQSSGTPPGTMKPAGGMAPATSGMATTTTLVIWLVRTLPAALELGALARGSRMAGATGPGWWTFPPPPLPQPGPRPQLLGRTFLPSRPLP